MQIQNPWVGYLNRSYSSIKQNILNRLGLSNPEITDHSESNILIIIISIFAGLMEQLNYYIDNLAREAFIGQARRYSSMVSLSKLIDYRIKSSVPATVDIRLELFDINGEHIVYTNDFTLQDIVFATANNITFRQTEPVTLTAGDIGIMVIPCKQILTVEDYTIGQTSGVAGQILVLPSDYAHSSSLLLINGEFYEERATFGRSNSTDKHYIVDVSVDQIPFIRFGDDINGKIPLAGQDVILSYSSTQGEDGNVDPNTISLSTSTDITSFPDVESFLINNPIKASGGSDIESIERIRRNAPLSLRTLMRAVSKQDYIDVTQLAPGVIYADTFWDCGKVIDIYIAPNSGGIASLALINDTTAFVNLRKMWTTRIRVSPSGETQLKIKLLVTANNYLDGNVCQQQVISTMLEEYRFLNSSVNRDIRLSDIYALVDNLTTVDFLEIEEITTKPYARPLYSLNQLNADINVLPGSIQKIKWRVAYDGSSFRLFKQGQFQNQIYQGVLYTSPSNIMSILLEVDNYTSGDEWVFFSYPYNQDIVFDDFTVPILSADNLIVTVTEQP